ncbi:MAG: rhomboid family intramembrane serine protease [Fidelibacterota bacterium]
MRYQFQSEFGQHTWRPKFMTNAIKILIGINVVMFILKVISAGYVDFSGALGLSPRTIWPMIWQPITYMFIHGDIWHIGINMLVLWMFGSELEMIWGKIQFLRYYFVCGIGSGLVWTVFNIGGPYAVLIGASGAIYGILMAYGMLFPNRIVYLYFLIPIRVKWLVLILGAAAFVSSFNSVSSISHMTHLSGMIIGYIYLKKDFHLTRLGIKARQKIVEYKTLRQEKRIQHIRTVQKEMNRYLDKINEVGFENLTDQEKQRLKEASKRLSRHRPRD